LIINQEFAGALLMFLVLWPFVGVFGNTWTAWIAHFFFVMLVRPPLLFLSFFPPNPVPLMHASTE
jgi:hypothetical protein